MLTTARVAFTALALLLVYLALDLLLMLFAGVLLAIFLRSLARWVSDKTRLSVGWALAVTVLALLGSAVAAGWLYAPRLAEQSELLTQRLPQAAGDLTQWLRQYTWGRWVLQQASSAGQDGALGGSATTALSRITHGTVAFIVVLFTGLYLAAEPTPYIRGFLRLLPIERRRRAAETLYAVGHVLRWWLLGQAVAMALVGLAMGIGLALIGVQLALLLGVLAGLFEFIPFLGPLLALGPALVLSLAEGTQQAGYVLMLYAAIQTAEGYVLTPLVQRKAVELPPVLTIAAQVALSWAGGPLGLLVAVPLTAVLMVSTQMLYVQDRLGDDVEPEFEAEARREVARERTRSLRDLLPARAEAG